ncbi:ribonuclease H [Trifolium medium]|uniref:Ribonuclease H n=1 Tax=Trifolium medium TaxID=97028 RepID=A0A392R2M4_9FABA|nr:ribonuclease H [Trifolium medium]
MKFICDYTYADQLSNVVVKIDQELVLVGSKPPPKGWVKLNMDGSCREDGMIGCGAIISGSLGEWIRGFLKKIGIRSAYMEELWWGMLKLVWNSRLLRCMLTL